MTLLAALMLLSVPTAASLFGLALADPKRRRVRGQPQASPHRRSGALVLLAACACFAASTVGPVGLAVWASAVAAGGWAVSNGLAGAPDRVLAAADRASHFPTGAHARRCPTLRAGLSAGTGVAIRRSSLVALTVLGLAALLAVDAARRDGAARTAAAQRLVALGVLDRVAHGAATRRSVSPCLAALAADRGAALHDLLSDRAATLVLRRTGGVGGAGDGLQRCILAVGGEGAAVERSGDTETYAVDRDTAARIHTETAALLREDDALADLATGESAAAGLLCRSLAAAIGPEVEEILDLLRRDRAYAKSDDLLLGLPALDRLTDARRAGAPCPS